MHSSTIQERSARLKRTLFFLAALFFLFVANIKPRFIISDLHFGGGTQSHLEDFDAQASENFVRFLDNVSSLGGAKVILNGDVIDFPQIGLGIQSEPPQKFLGTTEAESTLRLQKAIAGHPQEFEALRRFLTKPDNELLLLMGNHDVDFAWNDVLQTFMRRIGATAENFKFGMVYKEGGVYVTHGHQYSDDNRIEVPINFTYNRLNSCWGTHFVEHFFNDIEQQYPFLDNARPMWKVVLSTLLSQDVLITGALAADLVIFLKNFGVPLQEYARTALFGWNRKTRAIRSRDIDAVTSEMKMGALRDRLDELRQNADFRRSFDAVFLDLGEAQWEQIFSRSGSAEYDALQYLQNTENRPQARGLFSQPDSYQQAAQVIARYHPATRVVIMGHTHNGVDGKELAIDGKDKDMLYFNTGTWTRTYDIPWWQLPRFSSLCEPEKYVSNSSVVRCLGAGDTLDVTYFPSWTDALSD